MDQKTITILVVALAAVLFLNNGSLSGYAPAGEASRVSIYDVNRDNFVNYGDLDYLVKLISYRNYNSRADLNGDGRVDSGDIDVFLANVPPSERCPVLPSSVREGDRRCATRDIQNTQLNSFTKSVNAITEIMPNPQTGCLEEVIVEYCGELQQCVSRGERGTERQATCLDRGLASNTALSTGDVHI